MKLFNLGHNGYLAGYLVIWLYCVLVVVLHFLHLHCSCSCAFGHWFPYDIVFYQAFISYTGGQSVSRVLLWQPSECAHLIVMILFCYFRKINMMMMILHNVKVLVSNSIRLLRSKWNVFFLAVRRRKRTQRSEERWCRGDLAVDLENN